MLKIECCWFGKAHFNYIKEALGDYQKRLQHFCKFTIKEWPEIKEKNPESLQHAECALIEKYLEKEDADVFILDEKGRQWTSIELAILLENKMLASRKKIIFIIGGAYGFSSGFKEKYPNKISFGSFTYSHQIMRILLSEQIYRAFTIVHHIPYHNE